MDILYWRPSVKIPSTSFITIMHKRTCSIHFHNSAIQGHISVQNLLSLWSLVFVFRGPNENRRMIPIALDPVPYIPERMFHCLLHICWIKEPGAITNTSGNDRKPDFIA